MRLAYSSINIYVTVFTMKGVIYREIILLYPKIGECFNCRHSSVIDINQYINWTLMYNTFLIFPNIVGFYCPKKWLVLKEMKFISIIFIKEVLQDLYLFLLLFLKKNWRQKPIFREATGQGISGHQGFKRYNCKTDCGGTKCAWNAAAILHNLKCHSNNN